MDVLPCACLCRWLKCAFCVNVVHRVCLCTVCVNTTQVIIANNVSSKNIYVDRVSVNGIVLCVVLLL